MQSFLEKKTHYNSADGAKNRFQPYVLLIRPIHIRQSDTHKAEEFYWELEVDYNILMWRLSGTVDSMQDDQSFRSYSRFR